MPSLFPASDLLCIAPRDALSDAPRHARRTAPRAMPRGPTPRAATQVLSPAFDALWAMRFLFLLAVPALRLEVLILERCLSVSIEQVQLLRMALVVAVLSHLSSCAWAAIGWRTMRMAEGSWVLHDDVLARAAAQGELTSLPFLAWCRGFYYSLSTFMVIVIGDVYPHSVEVTLGG